MAITFFPENNREETLLGEARALEARVAVLQAEKAELAREIQLVRDQNAFLLDEAQQWHAERAQLRSTVARQEVRIHDLERQLRRDSRNSSKPPSSDAPRPKRPARNPSGRRPGGQPGHPGAGRKSFGEPDREETLPVERCDQCGRDLGDQPALPGRHHQVAEWVERPVEVVEYEHEVKFCPDCRCRVEAPYPPTVIPGSRFGPRLTAMWALFNRWGFMSIEKLERLFTDEFGVPVSQGTIANGLMRVYEALCRPYEELAATLPGCPLLHIDETSWRIDGEDHWVWTVGTERFGFFAISKHRSRLVLESMLGHDFAGVIVSDFYDVYDPYPGQRCLAHLLRDLKAASQEPDAESQVFAREATAIILDGYELWRRYRLGPEHFANLRDDARKLREDCKAFLDGLPERLPELPRLIRQRFRDYWDDIWYFLDHPEVPPDNSLAERELRPIVTYRKVAGGSKSFQGAELTARVHTVLDTCRKQGRDPLQFIIDALLATAHPTHHEVPSLLEPRSPAIARF